MPGINNISGVVLQGLMQPTVPDVAGSFNAGRAGHLQNEQRLQIIAASQDNQARADSQEQRQQTTFDQGQDRKVEVDAALNLLTAYKVGKGGGRDRILQNILAKTEPNSPIYESVAKLASMEEGKAKEDMFIAAIDSLSRAGLLPPKEDTAIKERELAVDEGNLAARNRGLDLQEEASKDTSVNPLELTQLLEKRATYAPDSEEYKYFTKAIEKETGVASTTTKTTPTTLKKYMLEREDLLNGGADPESPEVLAYDAKINGSDIDMEELSQAEIDVFGNYFRVTGKMPNVGRGKVATKIRTAIVKSAAKQSLSENGGKTPLDAALGIVTNTTDLKAQQTALNQVEKQLVAMESFVDNIGMQVNRVNDLAKDIDSFDTRILNVPRRKFNQFIKGDPNQAKYDMFLTEIEAEIGKLASGSAQSIAELSVGAQDKWAKIHDKNLSVSDMLELLEETKAAANLRLVSVQNARNRVQRRISKNPDQQGLSVGDNSPKIEFLGFE